MPPTASPSAVTRQRRPVPAWLIAAMLSAAVATGATLAIERAVTADDGAAAHDAVPASSPVACLPDTPHGPGHC
jgi:hypothetical protein